MPEKRKAEAQCALDELFSERLLPFKLTARKVSTIGCEEYIVYFQDTRLHSVDFSWCEGECFKTVVRDAVLQRIKRLSNPLQRKQV